jgi:DMSO/TMAO reductase YedYZ heme-binding membrane subunit
VFERDWTIAMLTLTRAHGLWTAHTSLVHFFVYFLPVTYIHLSGVWLDVDERMYTKEDLCSKRE